LTARKARQLCADDYFPLKAKIPKSRLFRRAYLFTKARLLLKQLREKGVGKPSSWDPTASIRLEMAKDRRSAVFNSY